MTTTKLLIQRKYDGFEWETFAYPETIEWANNLLVSLREAEAKRQYGGTLRLIRQTTEVLA